MQLLSFCPLRACATIARDGSHFELRIVVRGTFALAFGVLDFVDDPEDPTARETAWLHDESQPVTRLVEEAAESRGVTLPLKLAEGGSFSVPGPGTTRLDAVLPTIRPRAFVVRPPGVDARPTEIALVAHEVAVDDCRSTIAVVWRGWARVDADAVDSMIVLGLDEGSTHSDFKSRTPDLRADRALQRSSVSPRDPSRAASSGVPDLSASAEELATIPSMPVHDVMRRVQANAGPTAALTGALAPLLRIPDLPPPPRQRPSSPGFAAVTGTFASTGPQPAATTPADGVANGAPSPTTTATLPRSVPPPAPRSPSPAPPPPLPARRGTQEMSAVNPQHALTPPPAAHAQPHVAVPGPPPLPSANERAASPRAELGDAPLEILWGATDLVDGSGRDSERRRRTKTARGSETPAGGSSVSDLRGRSREALAELLRDRHERFAALPSVLAKSVARNVLSPATVVLRGALEAQFDPVAALEANLAALAPYSHESAKLTEAMNRARDFATCPSRGLVPHAASPLIAQLRDAVSAGPRGTNGLAELDMFVIRGLVQRRAFTRLDVRGGVHLVASLFELSDHPLRAPLYVPDAATSFF
ncbi:MAG: hypothetical protein U0271_24625, partial [Polyangiaceae bacterium]